MSLLIPKDKRKEFEIRKTQMKIKQLEAKKLLLWKQIEDDKLKD